MKFSVILLTLKQHQKVRNVRQSQKTVLEMVIITVMVELFLRLKISITIQQSVLNSFTYE